MNMPPDLPDQLLPTLFAATVSRLLREPSPWRLQYQPAGGAPHDRAVGARLLAARGIASAEEQVVVTAGGQNALHAILSATLRPGEAIGCREFVYPGFKGIAERLGLRLVPVPDLDPDALDEACRRDGIRALYVVPTNDNPTARTLSAPQRERIAEVAARNALRIVEDDAYGPLAATPLPSFASLVPALCWHIASTSKIISPALRVAHVRAPSVGAALRIAVDVHETAIMAPPLNAAVVSAWIEEGAFERLLAAMRNECVSRQRLAAELLGDVAFAAQPEGYHLWLELPGSGYAHLPDLMRSTGVSIVEADRFAVAAGHPQAVRVSLGGSVGRDRLARALRLLHGYVAAPAIRTSALV